MNEAKESEQLRHAWVSLADGMLAEPCPAPQVLWELSGGELAPDRAAEVIDHVATCPRCAEVQRLATAMGQRPGSSLVRRRVAAWAGVGTAVLAAGLAFVFLRPPTPSAPSEPVFRGGLDVPIRSELEPSAVLSRHDPTLRWSAGPEGTLYDLRVMSPQLETLRYEQALEVPRFTVPAEILGDLPAKTTLHWQVVARPPDGSRIVSPTWSTPIE